MKKIKILDKKIKRRFINSKNIILQKTPLLTGFQPSENFHIGNYLISKNYQKNSKKNQTQNTKNKIIIRDLLQISNPENFKKTPIKSQKLQKSEKRAQIYKTISFLLASGISPKKHNIILQSKIPMISEMYWIINSMIPLHYLHDMKDYTNKKKKGSNVGLYLQPSLKTSDLLIFNPDKIVFGKNQEQNILYSEFAYKKINEMFNYKFLKFPKIELIELVQDFHDSYKKMGRTDFNEKGQINLLDDLKIIENKILKAKTDSIFEITNHKSRKEVFNLFLLFSNLKNIDVENCYEKYKDKNLKDFKIDLNDLVLNKAEVFQEKYYEFLKDEEYLDQVLEEGMEESLEMAHHNLNIFKRNLFLKNKFD